MKNEKGIRNKENGPQPGHKLPYAKKPPFEGGYGGENNAANHHTTPNLP